MMEQTDSGEAHHHSVLITRFDHMIVSNGAARLRYISDAASVGPFYIVSKREERIRAKRHIRVLRQPRALFFLREYLRTDLENILPLALGKHIHIILSNIQIDGVVPVGAFNMIHKPESEHLGRLPQEPVIRLAARQTRAVNAGLLPRADPDCLSALHIAYGIGLGIF